MYQWCMSQTHTIVWMKSTKVSELIQFLWIHSISRCLARVSQPTTARKCGKDSRSVSRLQRSASTPHSFAMGLAIPYDDYVSKAKPWYEVLRKVAFSPFGLFVLNAAYAILGDLYMIYLSVMTHDSWVMVDVPCIHITFYNGAYNDLRHHAITWCV